jgi:hypothetical protein
VLDGDGFDGSTLSGMNLLGRLFRLVDGIEDAEEVLEVNNGVVSGGGSSE